MLMLLKQYSRFVHLSGCRPFERLKVCWSEGEGFEPIERHNARSGNTVLIYCS